MKMKGVSVVATALVLTACASTKILDVWKDESIAGKAYSKVLVVGVFKKQAYRQLFENQMAELLQDSGVSAQASYALFPDSDEIKESAAREQIQSSGVDAVLVVRLVDTKKESIHTPGTTYVRGYGAPYRGGRGWYGYYGGSYQVTQTPGYTTEYNVSTVETQIFDVDTERSVWTVISETSETTEVAAIESYMKAIAEPLSASGLFPSGAGPAAGR